MKKLLLILTSGLFFVLTACSSPEPAKGTKASENGAQMEEVSRPNNAEGGLVMRIAHCSAVSSARDQGAQKMKEVIEKLTDGRIEVQVYPASQLGGANELIQGVQMGTVECTIQPSSMLGGFQPLTTLMDIPYLLPSDYEKLVQIETGPAGQALMATTESAQIKTLDIWFTGYKQFTCSKPLENVSDFSGLKFRSMPSQVLMAQYTTLKATPVSMDFSETYNALQTGAIDGQENPLDTITDMNFHEVQKYVTISNHGVLDQFIMVGKDWFEGLEPDLQEAIIEGAKAGRDTCVKATLDVQSASMDKIKAQGCVVIELDDAQIAQWRDALSPVRQVYLDNYGSQGGEELLELFEQEIAKLGE